MKTAHRSVRSAPAGELAELRASLAEAQATLRAIRSGEVDAMVVEGKNGPRVYTLQGAEHAYRVLIEAMNEGALTLTTDSTILYANQCFARMVKCRLEQVTGTSFRRFLAAEDRQTLRAYMQHAKVVGTKFQTVLHADDGSQLAVLVSVRPLPRNGSENPILAVVVTDMTEARRTEERLRALSQRVISAQETERGRVALELHDRITQLLCAILTRSQVLADKLPSRETASRREAAKLNDMLGQTAEEVERISRDLRPSVLGESGLVPVLRHTSAEFARRSGLTVSVTCARLNRKLASDTELTLYRILQETLRNVQQHARASRVTVRFTRRADAVQLAIHDDGIGFDPARLAAKRGRKGGLGLLNMRERIAYVGGSLRVISARGRGTTIEAQIPFRNGAPASGGGTRPRSHSAIL